MRILYVSKANFVRVKIKTRSTLTQIIQKIEWIENTNITATQDKRRERDKGLGKKENGALCIAISNVTMHRPKQKSAFQ